MENIKVSGVLYITDLLTKEGIIEKEEMASALERLLKSNNRLPKRLIKERIEALRKQEYSATKRQEMRLVAEDFIG